ncbi:glutathione S-transferase [Thalassococcus sp. S3]|uniref:glutathione S-transferase n=1 Tax=Thalassococcus sp. S3 TaxID=2017482 RepID=UPI00102431E7|nr:glutathione S-transferase [Thalassococcus sp. S3]QBF34027.1 glutathione S-transferase [Thalassococcus sp. S3]
MKLYYSPTSPYVRKVMVLLHETGQIGDVELVQSSTAPTAPTDILLPKNPLAKIPALERPEGPTLFDSRVICAYLDDRGKGGLYPEGPRRWETLTLEALADGILDAALLMTYERRLRPDGMQWEDWSAAQWSKIERACTALNTRWMSHLAGKLDMGQIAVACALGYVDFRHDSYGWRNGNDALAAWFETMSARPSLAETVPPEGG